MLAAILQEAGYKTGLYTSPHLKDFRERIRINGEMIPSEFVTSFVEAIIPSCKKIEPSFFELTVAMAFDFFAKEKIDIAVVETGLGGRLDSTNILNPVLSVITNIGYDHQNILGNSLEEICYEKAGIIKSKTPVVIGETTEITRAIFQQVAKEKDAPIHFASEEMRIDSIKQHAFSLELELTKNSTGKRNRIETDLHGIYQLKNIRTVFCALDELKKLGFILSDEHITSAMTKVKSMTGLRGRWDVLREKPLVILDVAHNEDGIRQLLEQLHQMKYDKLHLVMGMVNDKDASKVLGLLPQNAIYYFTNANIPRALPAADLKEQAGKFNLKGEAIDSVKKAYNMAIERAGENDLVLVCGSIFVVAEVV